MPLFAANFTCSLLAAICPPLVVVLPNENPGKSREGAVKEANKGKTTRGGEGCEAAKDKHGGWHNIEDLGSRFGGGGGGYSHIWATRVCAAQQGMLFASLALEQGIKVTLSLLKPRVYFTLGLTLEQGRFFPES